jgi:hypothetical protein
MCKDGIFNSKQQLHHNYCINKTQCQISQFIVPSQEECKETELQSITGYSTVHTDGADHQIKFSADIKPEQESRQGLRQDGACKTTKNFKARSKI